MVILLVHLMSDSMEASLIKKGGVIYSESLPLHANLKTYLSEAHSILAKNKEKIENIVCILGPSFSTASTVQISKNFEKPVKIDTNFIQKITSSLVGENEIENEIFATKVNGYLVSNPLGKEGSTIDLTIYKSNALSGILNELKENILPISKKVHFHTFGYVLLKTFSRSNKKSFVTLEIENEKSTFSITNEDSMIEQVVMEIGSNHFLKSIVEKLNVDEDVAISLFKMRNEKTLDQPNLTKMNESLEELKKKWMGEMYKAFTNLSSGVLLTKTFYLITSDLWKDYFMEIIKQNEDKDFMKLNDSIEVNTFNPQQVDLLFIQNHLI